MALCKNLILGLSLLSTVLNFAAENQGSVRKSFLDSLGENLQAIKYTHSSIFECVNENFLRKEYRRNYAQFFWSKNLTESNQYLPFTASYLLNNKKEFRAFLIKKSREDVGKEFEILRNSHDDENKHYLAAFLSFYMVNIYAHWDPLEGCAEYAAIKYAAIKYAASTILQGSQFSEEIDDAAKASPGERASEAVENFFSLCNDYTAIYDRAFFAFKENYAPKACDVAFKKLRKLLGCAYSREIGKNAYEISELLVLDFFIKNGARYRKAVYEAVYDELSAVELPPLKDVVEVLAENTWGALENNDIIAQLRDLFCPDSNYYILRSDCTQENSCKRPKLR